MPLIYPSILFGYRNNLASHPERSTLNHSCGYASAANHPTCLASLYQNSNPGVKRELERIDLFEESRYSVAFLLPVDNALFSYPV